MSEPTRGFLGRRNKERDPRLPPGQYDVGDDFPVLSAEVTPRLETDRWTMSVDGLVTDPQTWGWEGLHELPESEFRGNIHCVTSWSTPGSMRARSGSNDSDRADEVRPGSVGAEPAEAGIPGSAQVMAPSRAFKRFSISSTS